MPENNVDKDRTWREAFLAMADADGNIDMRGMGLTGLPSGPMTVRGDLVLANQDISELPEDLTVGGSLDISGTGVRSLPKGLKVGKDLHLSLTRITGLPEGLEVPGNLWMTDIAVTRLPKGLRVGGILDVTGTGITALPDDLRVGGDLVVWSTGVTRVPEGAVIGGYVDWGEVGLKGVDGTMVRETQVGLKDGSGRHMLQVAVPDPESVPAPGRERGYGSFLVHPDAVSPSGSDGKVDIWLGDGKSGVRSYRICTGVDGSGNRVYGAVDRTAIGIRAQYEADVRARKRRNVQLVRDGQDREAGYGFGDT